MRSFDYIPSVLDGTELNIDRMVNKSMPLPEKYNYSEFIPTLKKVKDQGDSSLCVPFSLSYILETLEYLNKNEFSLDRERIYAIRSDKSKDGMQIKEALSFLKKEGYAIDKKGCMHHIKYYGKLNSLLAMKASLIANGPFILSLPVYDDAKKTDFWNGTTKNGGHAITCVGYNKSGLILENSWGKSWGTKGKVLLPYSDVSKILEAWAIIK